MNDWIRLPARVLGDYFTSICHVNDPIAPCRRFNQSGLLDRISKEECGPPPHSNKERKGTNLREGIPYIGLSSRRPTQLGRKSMARKTVVVSDMSGEQIAEGKGAKVRITFDDARSGSLELDVTADEARAMGAKGRQVARRGRRPKSS
jgi:hypothetical protein